MDKDLRTRTRSFQGAAGRKGAAKRAGKGEPPPEEAGFFYSSQTSRA